MIACIDRHKDRFGVEPICDQLPTALSTYYEATKRPPSPRAVRDRELKVQIARVHGGQLRRLRRPEGLAPSCSARASGWLGAPWSAR